MSRTMTSEPRAPIAKPQSVARKLDKSGLSAMFISDRRSTFNKESNLSLTKSRA